MLYIAVTSHYGVLPCLRPAVLCHASADLFNANAVHLAALPLLFFAVLCLRDSLPCYAFADQVNAVS